MSTYLFVCLLAIGLSFFDWNKKSGGLIAAFVVITIFLGFRFMYGNDYPAYLDLFKEYNTDGIPFWDVQKIIESESYGEPGWKILNKLFQPFGFFGLMLTLSVFENIVIYKLIKRSVPSKWYWLAIFVYMFNTRLFLIGACSMERQWLAICVTIIATKYIEQKKIVPYIILVLLASTFHSSAYFMLPFYFLCYVKNIKLEVKHAFIIVVALVVWNYVVPLLMDPIVSDLFLAENTVFSDYARFADKDVKVVEYTLLGLISEGIVIYLFPLLCLLSFPKLTVLEQKMTILYVLALFIKPFAVIIPMTTRIDYFFIIYSIFLIPIVLSILAKKKKFLSYMLVALLVIIYLRQTAVFLTESSWAPYYEYKTILSQLWM